MNYDLEMEHQIENIEEGTEILLHACCAPCSSAVLERLSSIFKITIFYYNPNIDTKEEFKKRVNELRKFVNKYSTKYEVKIIEGKHDKYRYEEISKGLENEPERGKRCYKCYELRLEEAAKIASKLNIPYFATTLTLSPHKNVNWLNEIGKNLDKKYKSNYLYSDFKKKEGYKRSIELSKEYNLYRQDYCGCIYSKQARDKKNEILNK